VYRLSLLLIIISTACLPLMMPANQPTQNYRIEEELLFDEFERVGEWRTYESEELYLNVEQGAFYATLTTPQYVWTQNRTQHENVVMQVDVFNMLDEDESVLGLMCRASPQNNSWGYYFLITSDGYYSIRRGAGGELQRLSPSLRSNAINTGQRRNVIRAVCIDDYLALYVNGEFVVEVRDDRYRRGYSGLAVALFDEGELSARFDNLHVWSANLAP